MRQNPFPVHTQVRRRNHAGVFTVQQWYEAANKYQLKFGNEVLQELVSGDDLEAVEVEVSGEQSTTLVPDPLIGRDPY